MPGVSIVIDDSPKPSSNGSVTCFHHPKDISVDDSSSVLTEIKLNTLASPSPSPSYPLKRKRTLNIQIPLAPQQPQTPKLSCCDGKFEKKVFEFSTSGCSVFCKKGRKKVMEDAHKIVSHLNVGVKKGFFGVYDGHGGHKAAEFVADNLHTNIFGMLEKCGIDMGKEEAVRTGYLKTDEEFLKQGLSSGTCCVTALIEEGNIVVSNLGDCRAVLCRGGMAEALTTDHKAECEDEQKRIEEKGGYVDIHHGVWRIQGTLAVSRSIGDVQLKEWVLAEPDTKILPLTSDMDFLILASDGLWDKVSNQEAISTTIRSLSAVRHSESVANDWKEDEDVFGNENSPPLKTRWISLCVQKITGIKCSNQYNNDKIRRSLKEEAIDTTIRSHLDFEQSGTDSCNWEEDEDVFGSENSPPSKARRISLSVQQITRTYCSNHDSNDNERLNSMDENINTTLRSHSDFKNSATWANDWRKHEDACGSENSPRKKVRRISPKVEEKSCLSINHDKSDKNIWPADRFMVACKKLVSLAVNRGSLDDITVMIIDLKQFHLS
ncbi:hypothetical protein MRB53_007531 [Persea americana]|uniref:Uncharacterized protein n=1 Tax=Persea americana TaxID=3435 RepID=A0ACC2MJT4_PERAE|nr:hypothetical protein MRB53_007531 [Persea americana]